ncbi:MAG: T9SS type A sorting domain-containing protein, partial [Chitinophagaceae bacterium]
QYIVRGYRNGVEQVTETVDFPTSATYGSVTYTRNVNYYLGGTLNFSSTAEWKNIDEVRFYWNDNFGMVGTLKSIDFEPAITGTLPVKLLDYKADIQPNGFVKVQWSTTQENNNSHFLIERSVSNSNFTVIGRVEAKGAEANHNDYSFIDEQPVAGTAYYRLIQYDLDGRSESYKILAVEKPLKTLLSIYPNPVTGNGFTVTLGGVITTPVRYTLSNIAGKMISQGTISSQQQFIPLSSALPGGTYILSTSDGQRIKLLRR